MTETIFIPSYSHDQLRQVQPTPAVPPASRDDGPTRNTSQLLAIVSRVKNGMDQAHASMMQYAASLGQQRELRPADMLLLGHRMALQSAQLSSVKNVVEELGRGINSLTNR